MSVIFKLVRLSLFSLCLTESCLIFLEGGVFVSVVFMLFLLAYISLFDGKSNNQSWLAGWSCYIESELLEQSTSLQILDSTFYRHLTSLYWCMYVWGLMLILQTFVHLFLPLGILASMPYHISYWLFGSALGLLLCVYVCVGWEKILSFLDRGLRDNFYLSGVSFVSNHSVYSLSVIGGVYNRSASTYLLDILSISAFVRGIYPLLNWLYQVSYFGARLFLVFVLHSFCLGCFGELFTSCTDKCLWISFPVGGLVGLGLALSLLMVVYLLIQIYVYISFSVSFLYKTLLSYYRIDSRSYLDHTGPSFWLVPVSLVDLFPTHYYVWLIMWLLGTLLSSRVWMGTYSVRGVCLHVYSNVVSRISRPN